MKKLLKAFKKKDLSARARDLNDDTASERLSRTTSEIVTARGYGDDHTDRTGNPTPARQGEDLNSVQAFASFDGWLSSFQPAFPVASELPSTDSKGASPFRGDLVKRQLLDLSASSDSVPPGDSITIIVSNVRKIVGDEVVDVKIKVATYMTLAGFNKLLSDNGLKEVSAVRNSALSDFKPNAVDDRPVTMVVGGVSSYSEKDGFRINQDESFEAYNNKLSQVRMLCKDSELVVNDGQLTIAFHRTLRLPEDGGKVYNLPTTFGPLPLYSTNSVTSRLLKSQNENLISIAKKGGVFLPLYQREATLISFRSSRPYAIRVFVGGVNAISGRPWNAPSKTSQGEQDYVTVPSQEWLDGIAVDRWTVRQFVAMPLGAGYSVENQVTGKEELGGFQLEIIPSGEEMRLSSLEMKSRGATATYTPRQTDMKRGECLTVHGVERQPLRVRLLRAFYESKYRTSQGHQKWRSGAEVQMTAIYRFDLTVQFYDSDGALTERVEVDCFPWDSIRELRKSTTDEKILWDDYTDRFRVFYEDKIIDTRQSTCISDLGVENHSIIKVWEKKVFPLAARYEYGPRETDRPSPSDSYQSAVFYSPQPMMQTSNPDNIMAAASAAPRLQNFDLTSYPYASSPPRPPTWDQAYAQSDSSTYSRPLPPRFSMDSEPLPLQSRPAQEGDSKPKYYQQSADSSTYSRRHGQHLSGNSAKSPPRSQRAPQGGSNTKYYQQSADSSTYSPPLPRLDLPTPLSHTYGAYSPDSSTYSQPPMPQENLQPRSNPLSPRADNAPALRWDMGVAAGARLRQCIERDKHNPSIWQKKGSCLVNVQILNFVAFEALTGMLTPPTPITPELYLEYGFPFYTQYGEEGAKTSGETNFELIKSVGQLDGLGTRINLGTSLHQHAKVGCAACKKNLCDCIIRPCNHTFCSTCVWRYMKSGARITCRLCSRSADQIIGFAAPMGLPGQDRVDLSTAEVRTLPPRGGQFAFKSIAELMGSEVLALRSPPYPAELEAPT